MGIKEAVGLYKSGVSLRDLPGASQSVPMLRGRIELSDHRKDDRIKLTETDVGLSTCQGLPVLLMY